MLEKSPQSGEKCAGTIINLYAGERPESGEERGDQGGEVGGECLWRAQWKETMKEGAGVLVMRADGL